MKFVRILALFAASVLSIGNVMAVPSGRTVEFASSMGKVTFDGEVHADKGLKCANCHTEPKLFAKKIGSDKITMAAMNEGKFCGSCHDGKTAFSVKSQDDCMKCHKTDGTGAKADAKAPMSAIAASKPGEEKPASPISTKESTREYAGDALITTKVKAQLLKEASLKSAEINVETFKGIVQLSGFVRSRADINKATKVAKRVKGVKSVKNDMILKGTQ